MESKAVVMENGIWIYKMKRFLREYESFSVNSY